jgi:hypothetical protein
MEELDITSSEYEARFQNDKEFLLLYGRLYRIAEICYEANEKPSLTENADLKYNY